MGHCRLMQKVKRPRDHQCLRWAAEVLSPEERNDDEDFVRNVVFQYAFMCSIAFDFWELLQSFVFSFYVGCSARLWIATCLMNCNSYFKSVNDAV